MKMAYRNCSQNWQKCWKAIIR